MRRTLAATTLLALLTVAGCAAEPSPGTETSPTAAGTATSTSASPAATETAQPSATTAQPTPPASPGKVAEDQRFTLEDLASFDDGLVIEVAGTVAQEASPGMVGAEATNGEMVVASVRIENSADAPYDPTGMLISVIYGDGVVAPQVRDPSGELQSGFEDPIPPNNEGVATLGFAVPFSKLAKVTFVIDLNDDSHEPVSFTGQVMHE